LANQTAYLDGTLRWGLDWLIKAHPETDVLFVQVGDPNVDSNYWSVSISYGGLGRAMLMTRGGDQGIPTPRPAYQINSSAPGTDAFAAASAAFSIASLLYTPGISYNATDSTSPPTSPSLGNASYAATLLEHAQSLYTSAQDITPYTLYSDSVPAAASAYGSSRYTDDLCYSALALALATNESQYYQEAYQYYVNYSLTASHEVWNWDSKTPAIYLLFVEAALARPGLALGAGLDVNLTGWQTEAEGYLDRIVNNEKRRVSLTRGQLVQTGCRGVADRQVDCCIMMEIRTWPL
jgi:endoglucanase